MVRRSRPPQRIITENMIRRMKLLIAEDIVKNRVEIGQKMGMHPNSIYRMEKDETFTFTLEQFYRFCDAFKIDPKELFPK